MPRAPRIASVAGAGTGKQSVRALNPAGALDHGRSEHARLAEQFQRDGRADDIHDGIHRADFVEMDFRRRQAVNFSLRLGDALKNGDGFLLHPGGKFAARNQLFDFRKIPLVLVVMAVSMAVVMRAVLMLMVVMLVL